MNGRSRINLSPTKQRLDALLPSDARYVTFMIAPIPLRPAAAGSACRDVVEAVLSSLSIGASRRFYNRYSYGHGKAWLPCGWARHVEVLITGKPAGNVVEMATSP